MAEIEMLTESERLYLLTEFGFGCGHLDDGRMVSNGQVIDKVLRIIRAQGEHITELQAQLGEARELIALNRELARPA